MSDNKKQQGTSLGKRLALIGVAVAIIVIAHFLPTPEGLSYAGKMAIALMVSGIVLWVTEPVPMAISGLALMCLMPGFGIFPYNGTPGVWANFISNVIFFILASFGITSALLKTKIPTKIVFTLMHITKGNAKLTVLMFMVATAVISAFVSNLPCTALFAGIAMSSIIEVEQKNGTAKHAANLGKALMIGIAYASCMGGMITPAGSALNIMTLNMLGANAGFTISFLDWVLVALPVVIIMTPICWFFITAILKPEPIADSCLQGIRDQAAGAKKIEAYEVKAILVIGAMLVLWIVGNWVPVLNATVVALIGLTVMFLPGMDLLTWKEFQGSVPWGIVIMCGTIMSMGGVVEATGGAAFLAGAISGSGVMDLGFFAAFALLLALIYLLHTVCPIGVAILGIFLPIMIALCAGFGVSPAVPTIALAVVVAGNYLMPVNPTVMLTYGEGYYTFGDMFKTGIVPSVALVLIMAAWMPFIVGVMGL